MITVTIPDTRQAPPGIKIRNSNRLMHVGDIYGAPSRELAEFSSLLVLVQVIAGVPIWARRSTQPDLRPDNRHLHGDVANLDHEHIQSWRGTELHVDAEHPGHFIVVRDDSVYRAAASDGASLRFRIGHVQAGSVSDAK